VSSDARTQSAPRARAVAGAPVEALLARADELARRWAIALILGLPLERIGEFPLESFAREAPSLCAAVIRALQSDAELERIAPGGGGRETSITGRLAEVTGARDGKAAVGAVEALRGVLWEALLEELRWRGFDAPAREVADLADRLAYVCSIALPALAWPAPAADIQAARLAPERVAPALVPADREPSVARSRRSALGDGVVIIDEGEEPVRPAAERTASVVAPPVSPPARASSPAAARRRRARPLPWDTPVGANSADARDEPA
jgi:hypothetical protein